LSVVVPHHLRKIGLLPSELLSNEDKQTVNYQMSVALSKIAFLPFGYIMDKWRWKVFAGEVLPEEYTLEWWKMVAEYQGLKSPVPRSENDFDPGAKFHVSLYFWLSC
jgi:peptidyl-dipeptidase A